MCMLKVEVYYKYRLKIMLLLDKKYIKQKYEKIYSIVHNNCAIKHKKCAN